MRSLRFVGLTALLTLGFLLPSLTPAPVLALDVTVKDGGTHPCTRDGLASAVGLANGGEVTFDCADPLISFAGTSQILINDGVTIDGANGDGPEIILDGNDEMRLFAVADIGTLALKNMTLRNGKATGDGGAPDGGGGAIFLNGSNPLTLTNITFESNQADDRGGAIYSFGQVHITGSSFSGNTSESGGAIYAVSQVDIGNSSFTANKANHGGAIFNSGNVFIHGSRFSNNQAVDQDVNKGGAIFVEDGKTEIDQTSFVGNQAGDKGGAIYLASEANVNYSTWIATSTFSENTAGNGGSALYVGERTGVPKLRFTTVVQPAGTTSALHMDGATILTDVILAGGGSPHCWFGANGALTDSYTLSNDTTCGLDDGTSQQGLSDSEMGLGAVSNTLVTGVTQTFYPLVSGSEAIDAGGNGCSSFDQLGIAGPLGTACDIGAIEYRGNDVPTVDAGGPYSGDVEENIALNGSASDGDTLTYSWSYTRGADVDAGAICSFADAGDPTTTVSCDDDGSYTLTLTVSDGVNVAIFDDADQNIIFVNDAPEITSYAPASATIDEGQSVTISVTASDPEHDQMSYSIDCQNDGTADDSTPIADNTSTSLSCTYPDDGTYTAIITVSDANQQDTAQVSVTVDNVVPSITSVTPASATIDEGQSVTIHVTANDPGDDDLIYSIDCQDDGTVDVSAGIADDTSTPLGCTYPDDGSYTAKITVSDGALQATRTVAVEVKDILPTITGFTAIPNPASVGQLVTLSATADDVEADKPLTITFGCGGGQLVSATQCVFTSGGAYELSVELEDNDGVTVTSSLTMQIFDPIDLCVNQWTGRLSVAEDGGCSRSEVFIALPDDGPLTICANTWNGTARAALRNNSCSRGEDIYITTATDSIPICVNKWNGALRVSDACSRSEVQDWL